ncbi:MAG: PIN domain-containing protein [Vulcanimicrobiaceae bacterium]
MAQRRLFRPRWSAQILKEAERNLLADGRRSEESASRRFRLIGEHFAEAEVTGYEHLIGTLICDEGDRHVLAAAIRGRADQIVTQNVKDFPDESVAPYFIEVVTRDDFLLNVLELYLRETAEIIEQQAAALRKPPLGVDDVLKGLSLTAPAFVQQAETALRALG